jgi:hypothetical protein
MRSMPQGFIRWCEENEEELHILYKQDYTHIPFSVFESDMYDSYKESWYEINGDL